MASVDYLDDIVIPDEPFGTIKKRPAPMPPSQQASSFKSDALKEKHVVRNYTSPFSAKQDPTKALHNINNKIGWVSI